MSSKCLAHFGAAQFYLEKWGEIVHTWTSQPQGKSALTKLKIRKLVEHERLKSSKLWNGV